MSSQGAGEEDVKHQRKGVTRLLLDAKFINHLGTKTSPIKALVDSGSMLNLVTELKAKELEWLPTGAPMPAVTTIDGKKLPIYATYDVEVEVGDSAGYVKVATQCFYRVDNIGIEVVLRYPWLCAHRYSTMDLLMGFLF